MTAGLGYDVTGPEGAPVVVLGSSLGATRAMWEHQVAALSDRFRVVAYDHRGHGQSEVPAAPYMLADLAQDVVSMLDGLGVERFTIGGLSLGGMVAMHVAAHLPERVERIALFCTSAYLPPAENWQQRAQTAQTEGTGVLAETVVGRWFTADWAAAHPDVVQRYRQMVASQPGEGYAGCCLAIAAMDLRPVLGHISAPTLLVGGADDPATPPDPHAETIAAGIGAGGAPVTYEVVPGAHLATVENAARTTQLLLEHLA